MGFTVTCPEDWKDSQFIDYARLLRWRQVDLGQAPRVVDPGSGDRWLYFWDDAAAARFFVEELRSETDDSTFQVVEVAGPSSVGPLGPIAIQMVRLADGLTFGLHPLAREIIRSAFPGAVGAATTTTISPESWQEYQRTRGDLDHLVRSLAPFLTGLSEEQLETLGYFVLEAGHQAALVYVPPALPVPA